MWVCTKTATLLLYLPIWIWDSGFGNFFRLLKPGASLASVKKKRNQKQLERATPPPLFGLGKSCWFPILLSLLLFPAKLLDQCSQLGYLRLQLPNFQHGRISLYIRSRHFNFFRPPFTFKVALVNHKFPLLGGIVVSFMMASVMSDDMGLFCLDVGGDEQERRVDNSHDRIIQALVLGGGHPPFKG